MPYFMVMLMRRFAFQRRHAASVMRGEGWCLDESIRFVLVFGFAVMLIAAVVVKALAS